MFYPDPLANCISILISDLPQRTLLWTSTAAGVTVSVDEPMPGRMYSGTDCSCARLTMRVPVWYPISPGP